jgi:DNA mismatch repair protein MutL
LLGALRTKFLTTDLTAIGTTHNAAGAAFETDAQAATSGASELVAWAKQQLGQQIAERSESGAPASAADAPFGVSSANPREPLQLHRIDVPPFKPFDIDSFARDPRRVTEAASDGSATVQEVPTGMQRRPAPPWDHDHGTSPHIPNALQVHNRYLVLETAVGIEVIDQHALHERILYEQIREKVLGGALEAQKLLVPEPVDLSPGEAAVVLEQTELLAQLGVEVQPFGGDTVLVSSYPAMLANLSPADVLRELVEMLLAGGGVPNARDLLDDLLHMIACKAAVKFGDRLSAEEIEALLAQRHLAEDSHHCPHGRPTALVFTREDLDRQFKRI